MKIIHRAGRVHSNVDPISRLKRRIPFYDSPNYINDPIVELNPQEPIDFYEKYRNKFESMTYYILKSIGSPNTTTVTISKDSISLSYTTSTSLQTLIYMSPEEIIQFVIRYNKDSHFSEVLKASGEINSKFPQYTTRKDAIILFNTYTRSITIYFPTPIKLQIF